MAFIADFIIQYEDLQQLAKRVGMEKVGIVGILLTSKEKFTKLKRNQTPSNVKLKFSCNIEGHEPWKTTYHHINANKWCPKCAGRYHESIARWYMEQIFKVYFPKILLRKIFPKYSGFLHFDGYAEINIDGKIIKITFEYNGRQHYEFPNQFHKSFEEFFKRLEYDQNKEKIAENNNIILIIIPYTIPPENMQNYIVEEFETKTGLLLPKLPKFNHKTRFVQSTTLNNFL